MAIFEIGKPIETAEPTIEVTVSTDKPIPVGSRLFQLQVVDEQGNTSEVAVREVIIRDTQRPTAVLDAPKEVEFGQSFKLSGERSSDVPPGKVVRYTWTLLENVESPPILRPIIEPTPILQPRIAITEPTRTTVTPDGR